MLRRNLPSLFRFSSSASASKPVNEEKSRSVGRKAVSTALFCLTGGVALSALDDLAIYHGCSSKAMEKASKNQEVVHAIGEPVVKGPWYSASLAVAHKRKSVSCTFPISGPQGSGVLRLKAVRSGDDSWSTFFQSRDFQILILDAVLYVPGNEETQRNVKINIADNIPSPSSQACTRCPETRSPGKQ
ncbi:Neutral trehalase [Bienertia sinuspersici]